MKPLKNFRYFRFIILPAFLVITFIYFLHKGEPEPLFKSDTKILIAVDSFSIPANDVKTHNYNLINLLKDRGAPDENGLRQVRTNYFLIVAGILSLILSSKIIKMNRLPMFLILLSLITLMYALDVHLKDLYNRQNSCYTIYGNNIIDLINKDSINTTWYNLDLDSLHIKWKNAANKTTRWKRKSKMAFDPDGEQIIYFIIPWILVYILTAREFIKNKT